MFRLKDYISISGGNCNEDAAYIGENYAFVLDGATGLFKDNVTPMKSDAAWFVQRWSEYLKNTLGNTSRSIIDILSDGVRIIADEYLTFDGADKISDKPSASLAIVREYGDKIEIYNLSDCVTIIDTADGARLFTDDVLCKLDEITIANMIKIAKEKNISVIEARPFVTDIIYSNRLKVNKPDGYYTLSHTVGGLDKAEYRLLNKAVARKIMIMTDGFSEIIDLFKICTTNELFNLADEYGLSYLLTILHAKQEKDVKCNNYPRIKWRDDATCLYFKLTNK